MRKWTQDDENLLANLLDKKREVDDDRREILQSLVDETAAALGYTRRNEVREWLGENADKIIEALQRWKEYE